MIYRLSQFLARLVFALLGRWRVTGREHVPQTGPAIVAPNHISYLDPLLIGSAIRRPMWFMAKAELFEVPGLKQLCRALQAFPVRRGAGDRAALKHTLSLLAKGEIVVVFPEGTRSKTGALGPPELGIGMLALRSGAPVVPVAISGTSAMLPRGAKLLRPARIRVKIGPPLRFPPPAERRNTLLGWNTPLEVEHPSQCKDGIGRGPLPEHAKTASSGGPDPSRAKTAAAGRRGGPLGGEAGPRDYPTRRIEREAYAEVAQQIIDAIARLQREP